MIKVGEHVTLDIIGESSLILLSLLDESIDATSAPESDDVTKKVTISTNENIDANKKISEKLKLLLIRRSRIAKKAYNKIEPRPQKIKKL